ncbi:MAG: hypothetical protein JWN78_2897 [Bacteroidota bacterium]|nr:hypothetical protein [Bacteroidota bacterium]
MKSLSFFILTVAILNLYGQQDLWKEEKKNILKFTPAKIIGISNPAIEITYERRIAKHFATQVMASCLMPVTIFDNVKDFNPKIRGFKFSAEQKYYYTKKKQRQYIAIEANYMWTRYNAEMSFGNTDTSIADNYLDSFRVRKQTFSINLIWGYQRVVKRFCFDVFVGLGVRYKSTQHYDRLNPDDVMIAGRHPSVPYYNNKPGKYWTFSFPLNIRLGWAF